MSWHANSSAGDVDHPGSDWFNEELVLISLEYSSFFFASCFLLSQFKLTECRQAFVFVGSCWRLLHVSHVSREALADKDREQVRLEERLRLRKIKERVSWRDYFVTRYWDDVLLHVTTFRAFWGIRMVIWVQLWRDRKSIVAGAGNNPNTSGEDDPKRGILLYKCFFEVLQCTIFLCVHVVQEAKWDRLAVHRREELMFG
jgi:hypothetical protein